MKKLLLLLFLIPILLFGQDGGYHGYVYKIPQYANTYNRLTQFDTNGYIKPVTNGVGYLYGNNGVFSFEAATSSNVTGIAFTGTNTITLTLTQISGGTLTATFYVPSVGLPEGGEDGDVLVISGGTATWTNLCDLVTACVGDLYTKVATLEGTVSEVVSYLTKKDSTSIPPINYGYLYNWDAATDSRNIAPSGWRVPTESDLNTFCSYVGNSSNPRIKDKNSIYWTSGTTNTNELLFNARGAGARNPFTGAFGSLTETTYWWQTTNTKVVSVVYYNTNLGVGGVLQPENSGFSIRLIKDSTTLSEGQTGTMTGNDGKVYRTICIGTQEWVADNLAETKYRNGDAIPEVTDNTAWTLLTSGARCSYNNIESNAILP